MNARDTLRDQARLRIQGVAILHYPASSAGRCDTRKLIMCILSIQSCLEFHERKEHKSQVGSTKQEPSIRVTKVSHSTISPPPQT